MQFVDEWAQTQINYGVGGGYFQSYNRRMKIAIVVGGKFHADRMANALLARGHDVRLYTTLPKSRIPAVPTDRIVDFPTLEIGSRLLGKLGFENAGDLAKIQIFGRRAAAHLRRSGFTPDVIFAWSSFGLESFRTFPSARKVMVRDSAQIEVQMELIRPEYEKRGVAFPDRGPCIRREIEESQICDAVLVCSEYVKRTFESRGISGSKVNVITLGADTKIFSAKENYTTSGPLRVIYFGALTLNKGIYYLLEATRNFSPAELELTMVGQMGREFKRFRPEFGHARWSGPLPHTELAALLRTQEVFVMPTLQDGFGTVVPQAMATGLACVISDQCGAKELIDDGSNGILIGAADASAIRSNLRRFIDDRRLVASLGRNAVASSARYTWAQYDRKLVDWTENWAAARAVPRVS